MHCISNENVMRWFKGSVQFFTVGEVILKIYVRTARNTAAELLLFNTINTEQ